MLKYTHGRWSWKFVDGNKPCIMIDDGDSQTNALKLGDMVLIENTAKMFEMLNRVADLDIDKTFKEDASQFIDCVNDVKEFLKLMNVAR